MKVAKAQHIKMKSQCIEESGSSSLSVEIDEVLNRIAIPFYQIIGIKIRFYLLLPINGDLYGVFEWTSIQRWWRRYCIIFMQEILNI